MGRSEMFHMNIISAAKKKYEDAKAAKLVKKLSEKKEYLARTETAKTEELKKTTRKPNVISQEYNQACGILGDKKYKATVLTKECEQIEFHLKKLNEEFELSQRVWKDEMEAERNAYEAAQKARQEKAIKQAEANADGCTGSGSNDYAGSPQGGANEAVQ